MLQMGRILDQLLCVGVLLPCKTVAKPSADGVVPTSAGYILHAAEGDVAVFDIVGVSHLPCQRKLRGKRADRRVNAVASGHQGACRLEELLQHQFQLAASQAVVASAIFIDILNAQFPPFGRSGIDNVPPVLSLGGSRVNFIQESGFLSWHITHFFEP